MATTKAKSKENNEEILFGVEMEFSTPEVSSRSTLNAQAQDEVEKCTDIVEDGSGRDGGGVEINLKPFPFDFFSDLNKPKFEKALNVFKKHKFTADNNKAGLHVHVDRSIFKAATFIKFLEFCAKNQPFIHFISRRKSRAEFTNVDTTVGKYGRSMNPNTEARIKEIIAIYENKTSSDGNHAIVLNVHGKHGTIECRFFNGTMEVNELYIAIQFVRSLCYFIKSNQRPEKTLGAFLKYIRDYRSRYPDLVAFLKTAGAYTEARTAVKTDFVSKYER